MTELGRRLGQFFFFLGVFLLVLFWGSVESGAAMSDFLLGGVGSVLVGIWLLWRNRPPPPEVERFKTLRKILSGRGKDK